MYDIPNTSEQMEQICRKILTVCRNELYLQLRFLDRALSSFDYVIDGRTKMLATDGFALYYHPGYLGGLYKENRILVNRAYLHILMHCIFRHMTTRNERDEALWDLAADIAAESVIDSLPARCVRTSRSWLRRETYRKLGLSLPVLTAQGIYRTLLEWQLSPMEQQQLAAEFTVCDHQYWDECQSPPKQNQIDNKWQDISEQAETDMDSFSREAADDAGSLSQQLKIANRERYDYRQFLRKFAVLREEMTVDPDSFDYSFYSYGLQLYGNMPLIEPQEWKEEQKIEDFAIVIDTSMSCSGELVKKFLEETYGILKESSSFFKKVNIHIIQCDEKVQSDQQIKNAAELKNYMEHLELTGGGGTDFRPAFQYISELIAKKAFSHLKGVLYFTDGYGTYPNKMPPYQTAFIFMKEDYADADVPAWAMKIILDQDS